MPKYNLLWVLNIKIPLTEAHNFHISINYTFLFYILEDFHTGKLLVYQGNRLELHRKNVFVITVVVWELWPQSSVQSMISYINNQIPIFYCLTFLNLKHIKTKVIALLVTPYDETDTKLQGRKTINISLRQNQKPWKLEIFRGKRLLSIQPCA